MRNITSSIFKFGRLTAALYLSSFLVLSVVVDRHRYGAHVLHAFKLPIKYLVQYADHAVPFDQEKFDAYLRYFNYVEQYVPNCSEGYAMQGYCYYQIGQKQKARAYYQLAVQSYPEFFWFSYNLAVIYFNEGDFKKIIPLLEKATALDPKTTIALLGSSRIYADLGGDEETAVDQEFTLTRLGHKMGDRLKSGYESAYEMLLISYEKQKNYQAMLESGLVFTSFNPRNMATMLYYVGMANYHLGHFKEAVSFLKESVHRDAQDPDKLYYFGLALKELHENQLAQAALDEAELLRVSVVDRKEDSQKFDLRIF